MMSYDHEKLELMFRGQLVGEFKEQPEPVKHISVVRDEPRMNRKQRRAAKAQARRSTGEIRDYRVRP